jgi:2-polyprenyl-6-hydroxyphenyl methylase/3-demethylubiquinone-9 3-methyltransferase
MTQENEILKFTEKASEWWDKNGSFKLLHIINELRINYIFEKIQKHFTDKEKKISIIDVGCGGGIACEALAKLLLQNEYNVEIYGIDHGYENIEIAKNHAQQSNLDIKYIHTSLNELDLEKTFDIVISLEVIEHVENYIQFLNDLSNRISKNGLLFLSTINKTKKSYIQAILCAEYILRWIPIGTHNWNKFIKPSDIELILRKHEISIEDITGFKYHPLKNKWYFDKNIDVNYILYGMKK